jgi:PRTRC genetic system ThiF family protein
VFISEKNRNLLDHVDVVIGCVDSKSGRRQIHDAISDSQDTTHYWLDLGNGPDHGQFVLGQPANFSNRTERLKTVADRYPEIIDTATPEDDTPSCSAVEALFNQEPFINQTLAMHALVMLTRLLRYGKLDHQGGFFNARTGTVQPISVATCKAA